MDSEFLMDKLCRTCLCEADSVVSLNSLIDNRKLADILEYVANLKVLNDDMLPKHICSNCKIRLVRSESFKKQCVDSELALRNMLDNGKLHRDGTVKREKNCVNVSSACEDIKMTFTTDENKQTFDSFAVKKEYTQDHSSFDSFKVELLENDVSEHFICHCGLKFVEEASFKDHIKEHMVINTKDTNEKDIPCVLCRKRFTSIGYLKLHMRYKHSKAKSKWKYQCNYCSMAFDTEKRWSEHTSRHVKKVPKINQCSICQKRYTKKSSLNVHIKRHHDGNTKNVCDVCNREFKYAAHLENHILSRHTKEDGITCDHCTKKFATQESLKMHQDRLAVTRDYRCTACDKSFYVLSTLKDHLRTHTGEKPFLCTVCGKGFSQKGNMVQHVRRHQGLKRFKCETCERRFVSRGELNSHQVTHTGAHPHECDLCGKAFTMSTALAKHKRIHTGEKRFACEFCPMRFTASDTLKHHRRTHTGEKPYQCSYCEKAFIQKHDLVSHIRCHTGEKPFVCPTCGQAFRTPSILRNHLKTHLKESAIAKI